MYRPITPFCDPRYVSFTTPYTQCLCVPSGNPHAFLFRSSPRTSALAVGERETALGSPPCGHRAHTYTHTPLFPRPGTSWTFPLSFPVFPLWPPNPSTRRRITRAARVRKPSAENPITHTKLLTFPPFYVCCVPPTYDTHTCFLFPLLLSRLPCNTRTLGLCLRLFEIPFPSSWCTNLWNPAPEFTGLTLFRFGELT